MKAAVFNPYLDSLGGGERYTLSFAKVLESKGYEVIVQWPGSSVVKLLETRFGMDLKGIKFVDDIKRGDGCDICFWVSDGSIPTLRARKNFLHFQVPFHNVGGRSLLNKMKLFRINKIICNSFFTKSAIDKEYGVNSVVIYPPVSVAEFHSKRKENMIMFVGRFSQLQQNKHQDILISSFRKIYDSGLTGWRLVLVGGVEVGVGNYIASLKKMIEGYPIEILQSPTFERLVDLFGRSKLFWSASGYGANEKKSPEKVEHFGMSVVEAMASGSVPVIFDAGGHREIIDQGVNGYLWRTKRELRKFTKMLIDGKLPLHKISLNAIKSSKQFSYEKFGKNIESLL